MGSRLPTGALVVAVTKSGEPHYEAKWRWQGRQVKRRLGPAWLVANGDGWIGRKGRPPEGWLDEKRAVVAMAAAIAAHVEEEATADAHAEAAARRRFTFSELAGEWLDDRRSVGGLKHTTLTDYEAMLRQPDASPRKRGSAPQARIMRAFGQRPAAEIDADEVARFLRALDKDPAIGPRTVNKHRQVLHTIFAFGVRQRRIASNPAADTPKRRENDAAEILTYTPEQVYAIAAARAGAHRDRAAVTEDERQAQRLEDEQDAAIIIVAAFCGLRMGELLALRWRHVLWDARRLHVVRSYSLRTESSTKSRKARTVPLADQPAKALADLALRGKFTSPGDLVFCSRTGEHLDDSALRRRYKRARDAAMRQDSDMEPLRFHDLRHTFGTLAASRFDAVNLQAMLGHADSRTTARYLHARPAVEDADKLTKIFGDAIDGPVTVAQART